MGLLFGGGDEGSGPGDPSSSLSGKSGSSMVDPLGDEGGAEDVGTGIVAISSSDSADYLLSAVSSRF